MLKEWEKCLWTRNVAATLRYEKGMFYLLFVANDTGKTYLFRASDLKGPWQKNESRAFTMTARFCLMRAVPSLPTETVRFM